MKLIVNPRYGYFVGWRKRDCGYTILFDAVWQPNVRKAVDTFRNYLLAHPSTDVEKELKLLKTRKVFEKQVEIVNAL